MTARTFTWLRRLLCALLLGFVWLNDAAACSSGACVSAGPRLASVSTARAGILNTLLGSLAGGSSLNLSVADWNALATGDVSLAATLSALQAQLGVSSPTTALTTNASVAQLITAMATAATGEGKTSLAAALNNLKVPLTLLAGNIKLGDLITTDGALGTTRLNALELVTGIVQLYNGKNVVTTPGAITVSGSALGIPLLSTSVTLAAQVVEPPVFVCGPTGSTFHTATIRVKLGIDLLTVNLNTGLLAAIPLVNTVSASLSHLDLYLEVARADGVITAVNAITNAFSVRATPGVADLYLGTMPDSTFFNRSRTLSAADLDWGTIGSLSINGSTLAIRAKAAARGGAASATNMNFTGTPQTFTASSGATFVTTLLNTLLGNLQLDLTPAILGGLTSVVTTTLVPIVQLTLGLTLQPLVDGLINPLLESLGVRLGEVDVNSGGTVLTCSISGSVYEDANHTGRLESGETGTGVALYAKLVPTATPSAAYAVATVDPTTGSYTFANIPAAAYSVVVNASASSSVVAPAVPTGWVGTENPTLSLAATITTADLTAQRFGLYHGSKLAGSVFSDNGATGGTAHNGVRDGGEAAVVGVPVAVTNAAGSTSYDSTTSGDLGRYTLWVPWTVGAVALRVAVTPTADWVVISGNAGTTGGSFGQANAATAFTNVVGLNATGIDFGLVPANRFEPDGQQQVLPGSVAFFAHTFTAGTAGQLTLANATTGNATGWNVVVYADSNCNGRIDSGELPYANAGVATTAGQKVCIVVKVSTPATAAYGAQVPTTLTAHFAYASTAIAGDLLRNDVVTIGNPTNVGLRLVKAVDKTSAAIGSTITYTITYTNASDVPLTSIRIVDMTPAYTVLSAATCGSVPNAQISCAVAAVPAVGATGHVEWALTGSLVPGGSGTVSMVVVLQ